MVVLVRDVVDAGEHGVVAGNLGTGVQIEHGVATQHDLVGSAVVATRCGVHFSTHGPIGDHGVGAQVGVALGAACQLATGIQIVWVLEVERAIERDGAQLVRGGQGHAFVFGAAHALVATVAGWAGSRGTIDDQVAHAIAVRDHAGAAGALRPTRADFQIAAGFRLQRCVAVFAEALVQRRRTERGSARCRHSPFLGQRVAVGQAAGALATEFAVLVAAQIRLQGVRAGVQRIAERQSVLRTIAFEIGPTNEGRGVVQLVLAALERCGQAVNAEMQLVLKTVIAQRGLGHVEIRSRAVLRIRLIHFHSGAVDVIPLRIPCQSDGAQLVVIMVILDLVGVVL